MIASYSQLRNTHISINKDRISPIEKSFIIEMDMLKNNEIQKIDTITFAERYKLNRPSKPTPPPSPPPDPPGPPEANCYMNIYTSNNTIMDHSLPTINMFMMDNQGFQDTEIKVAVDDKLFWKVYLCSKSQHQDITDKDNIDFGQTLIRFEEYCDTSERYETKYYDSNEDEHILVSQDGQYDPTRLEAFI